MSMNRATTIALVGGATAITLVAGYAVYFDYKRQTDKEFRRKLREFELPSSSATLDYLPSGRGSS
jgi:hypothetical protein